MVEQDLGVPHATRDNTVFAAFDPKFPIGGGANRNSVVSFANKEGWGRISVDDYGNYCIVIDGQRYTADELLRLFSCYEGFNVCWNVRDQGDSMFD